MGTPSRITETNPKMKPNIARADYKAIIDMVRPDVSILDLGCGEGDLMSLLVLNRNARIQGIEIDEQAIYRCVGKGLSVFQGDIDSGLSEYPEKSFDYVILNQSFQQVKNPDAVLSEALRVGKEVIVGVPNFAHYSARFQLGILGRAPVTSSLPYQWYNTPNTHFFSILDFANYCRSKDISIEKSAFIAKNKIIHLFPNFFADIGIFLICK